jgi:hypothetical protein
MICLSLAKSLVGTGINLELFLVEEGSDDTFVVWRRAGYRIGIAILHFGSLSNTTLHQDQPSP